MPEMSPALPLREYQKRWINDKSRFKIAVKSARIGFSFATGLEAVEDCLITPNTTWTVLSASKAQSVEFIETCHKLIELMYGAAQLYQDEDWWDELGRIEAIQQRIVMPNGARLIALPANPRTARGYPGNAILDEFAHHEESYAIWAAITRQVALGHKVRVLSTPNGEQGKFYDLCKELGLMDGVPPAHNFTTYKGWSVHWINADMAIADGCPINMQEMRDLIKDEDIIAQEFYCVFLKSTGSWLPLDLVSMCEEPQLDCPLIVLGPDSPDTALDQIVQKMEMGGIYYAGIDVGRDHDATTLWLDEQIGDVSWTRAVVWIYATPFPKQIRLLNPVVKHTLRTAIDRTGMGVALVDGLEEKNAGRIMGVSFAGSNDNGVKMKTDLAVRIKKKFEKRASRIPFSPQVRTELMAIKRESTASGVTFDAPRIEVDTAVAGGVRKKKYAHADAFWAKALADFAAESSPIQLGIQAPPVPASYTRLEGYF